MPRLTADQVAAINAGRKAPAGAEALARAIDGLETVRGVKGDDGAPGRSFYAGDGAASMDLGLVGDLYLELESGDVSRKAPTAWSTIGNIKGPQGEPGVSPPPAEPGAPGKQGPRGLRGAQGDPGVDGVGPDEKVKLDAADPEAGYLEDKIQAGIGVKLRRSADGKAMVIDAPASGGSITVARQGPGGGGGQGPKGDPGDPGPKGDQGDPGPQGDPGGGSSVVEELTTSETDTSLVLAPDGVGGVEFRAESGGSPTTLGQTAKAPIPLAPVDYLMTSTAQTIPARTYDNGPDDDGIGATITENDPTAGVLTVDGAHPTVGQRIGFHDSSVQNGIYVVTAAGNGSTVPWILTRSIDCDSVADRCRFWVAAVLAGTNFAQGSIAVGDYVTASGLARLALSGYGSTALGSIVTAYANASFAAGDGPIAKGYASQAFGNDTLAEGANSFVAGGGTRATEAANDGAAFGNASRVDGFAGFATGYGSRAYGGGQRAHSSGSNGPTVTQTSEQTYSAWTTDETPTQLAAAFLGPFTFPGDAYRAARVKGVIVARRLDVMGTDGAWDFEGVARLADPLDGYVWVGGSAPVPAPIAVDAGALAWPITLAFVDDFSLVVTVAGEAAKSIVWTCTLTVDEVA